VSRRFSPRGDEAGVTLVLMAAMSVFMLIIVAIVIDGGQGYTDRRSMQNAADAAALAGARAIGQTRFTGASADLAAAVLEVATANGANATDVFTCDVVDQAGAALGPCSPNSGWSGLPNAAGVKVTAGVRRTPVFGSVVGRQEIVVKTTASATLQPLLASRAPWMICGNPSLAGGFDLVDSATRTLRPDATLRLEYGAGGSKLLDARGIPVQGALPGACGLSPAWVGAVNPSAQPVRLGSFVAALDGTPTSPYTYDDILGSVGCPSSFTDSAPTCNAVLPVFDETDSSANTARVVGWAVWRLTYASAEAVKWRATYVGPGVASGGVTSTGALTGRSTYVVRMAS
jgi:Flp pilus assembly protein TadG